MEEKTGSTVSAQPKAIEKAKSDKPHLLKKIPKGDKKETAFLIAGALVVVLLGTATGWLFSGGLKTTRLGAVKDGSIPGVEQTPMEAGMTDESKLPDTAEGTLEEGGIEGEGTYHLVREGGPAKYVYMTSTVIDLQSFVGKTVKVWGETLSAQKAGWLMDVGKIKVIE